MVFPAPFGPRKPKTSPRCTVMDSEFTAIMAPKRLVSPTAWIAGEVVACGEPSSREEHEASESRTGAWAADGSSAWMPARSAELGRDIQHILRIEDSGDGMEQASAVLPDHSGGRV